MRVTWSPTLTSRKIVLYFLVKYSMWTLWGVNGHVLPAYKRVLRGFKEPCLNVACSCSMRGGSPALGYSSFPIFQDCTRRWHLQWHVQEHIGDGEFAQHWGCCEEGMVVAKEDSLVLVLLGHCEDVFPRKDSLAQAKPKATRLHSVLVAAVGGLKQLWIRSDQTAQCARRSRDSKKLWMPIMPREC